MRAFALTAVVLLGACTRPSAVGTAHETGPAPSPSASTAASAAPPTASSAAPSSSETAMSTTDPHDLEWLDRLVKSLATGTMTRAQTIAFLGADAGPDASRSEARLVRPRLAALASASVYPLEHIQTPVATELVFTAAAEPTLEELAAKVGPFRPLPRAPDDFGSGDKFVRYVERADTKTTVRIFAEQSHTSKRIAKLSLDAYTRK